MEDNNFTTYRFARNYFFQVLFLDFEVMVAACKELSANDNLGMSPLYYDVPDHKPSRFTETIQPVIAMVPLHRPRFYITSITIKNCFQRMYRKSRIERLTGKKSFTASACSPDFL